MLIANDFPAEQYVRQTRRTLMLDGQLEKCECTITDNDDGEIQFSCVLSQEGIVCRNYRSTSAFHLFICKNSLVRWGLTRHSFVGILPGRR